MPLAHGPAGRARRPRNAPGSQPHREDGPGAAGGRGAAFRAGGGREPPGPFPRHLGPCPPEHHVLTTHRSVSGQSLPGPQPVPPPCGLGTGLNKPHPPATASSRGAAAPLGDAQGPGPSGPSARCGGKGLLMNNQGRPPTGPSKGQELCAGKRHRSRAVPVLLCHRRREAAVAHRTEQLKGQGGDGPWTAAQPGGAGGRRRAAPPGARLLRERRGADQPEAVREQPTAPLA